MNGFFQKFETLREIRQWAEDVDKFGLSHDDIEDVMRDMDQVYDQLALAGIKPPSKPEEAATAALLCVAFEIICDAEDEAETRDHDLWERSSSYHY